MLRGNVERPAGFSFCARAQSYAWLLCTRAHFYFNLTRPTMQPRGYDGPFVTRFIAQRAVGESAMAAAERDGVLMEQGESSGGAAPFTRSGEPAGEMWGERRVKNEVKKSVMRASQVRGAYAEVVFAMYVAQRHLFLMCTALAMVRPVACALQSQALYSCALNPIPSPCDPSYMPSDDNRWLLIALDTASPSAGPR